MREDQARDWLADRFGTDRLQQLERYVDLLLAANSEQNLIGRASEAQIWSRHILDSAQLALFAPNAGNWADIGSGPGLPGLVLAIVTGRPTLLVEPRRKRVDFLHQAVADLGLCHVRVAGTAVEQLPDETFDAITARAYAPLPLLLLSTNRLTTPSTIWVLPKGRRAAEELAGVRKDWHGVFHVEQSLSDPDARIIVATDVRRRHI